MSIVTSCETCASADGILQDFIQGLDVETAHHRMEAQRVKCGFGLKGICCKLCANGPCRVTPDSPRGVFGANADTIVARNFLRAVAAGSGCYIHVVENTARNLKKAAKHKGDVKSPEVLDALAETFGINETDIYRKAERVADAVLADLYLPADEKMKLTSKLAYAPRLKAWEKLGILPGGSKSEVFDGVVKSSTNLNSDPVDMLLHCLRLGISTGLYGLELTNLLNDIMLGDPAIRQASVGFKTVDQNDVNMRVHIPIHIPENHGFDDVVTGVSERSLKTFLGGEWKPLIDLIASGKIKGVAGVVGCSNLRAKGHDVFTVELVRELIKRDILVLSAGCSGGGLENVGLMSPGAAALAQAIIYAASARALAFLPY